MSLASTLEPQLLSLPAEERARLAKVLLDSLDGDADYERAWRETLQRRMAELDSGAVQRMPGPEVLAAARSRLA